MNTEGAARVPASESSQALDRKSHDDGAPATRRASRTSTVVGIVIVLLLLGAAAYYFVDRNAGTDVAMRPSSDNPSATTSLPAAEGAKSPAPTPASPSPAAPQQSASPAPNAAAAPQTGPQAAAPALEPQPNSPAISEQGSANGPAPAESKQPAQSAEAPPQNEPSAPTAATAQPSMRNQPAALPDQAAKNDTELVVMRGPANIRSAPGTSGRIIGTAAKNAIVKELSRSGKWVEVETDTGNGWIAAALLAPRSEETQ